ncbi:MAG TPA: HTH domain-containing protein [Deltaproteobacteria bacterium]|nr:HTH domain-containing protein [Deltaproteobacteria bacterium]
MDIIELIDSGKIKRFFRSRRKLNTPGLIYHITQRAAGKEPLFIEDDDYMAMLVLMKEVFQTQNMNTYAFCLMPNHIHLLVSPKERNLFETMRMLFSRYASRFNKKYQRKGHLFGGPYRQAVCLDDSYMLAASLYIHLNPVRAGLTSDPLKYRWTSIRLYLRKPKKKSFVNADFILSLLSDQGDRELTGAREEYLKLLKQGSRLNSDEVLETEEAIEKFLSRLKALVPLVFKGLARNRKISEELGFKLASMDEIEGMIEEVRKNAKVRDPQTRQARKYLIEQLLARGFKKGEIAEKLGVSRKTVYNTLRCSP